MAKKTTHDPSPFDICPKHHGFHKTCGCSHKGSKSEKKEEIAEMEDEEG
jgi:hypothetical protein